MSRFRFWHRGRAEGRSTDRRLRLIPEVLEERTLLTVYTIAQENALPGNPPSQWDLPSKDAGDPGLQGFATDISVTPGQVISFKINDTTAQPYHLDIYRLGYYQGNGARLISTIPSSATSTTAQPLPLYDTSTGSYDCGNWSVSASWTVPAVTTSKGYYATSGIYIAKVVGETTGTASQIVFVVRNDTSHSDILFQTSDSTWQAYNRYGLDTGGSISDGGGNSLYTGHGPGPGGRAYAVSYNRPLTTRDYDANEWVLAAEYPMVRFLESNGYNVSYSTDLDSERNGGLISNHKIFMSVGHDEYWSGGQRTNVEAALNNGVDLAFFSGNECFWKTRWANSFDASNTPYRTLVCYKESQGGVDPLPNVSTGMWRDPTKAADGGRPENGLTGTLFQVNRDRYDAITVPAADAKMRFWRNTSVAALTAGQTYTTPTGVLGFEWDEDLDNGARPAGLIDMSTTTVNNVALLQDYGTFTVDPNTSQDSATHHLTLYRKGKALVFGAGTTQWSWGLDGNHDYPPAAPGVTATDPNMQQATVNLIADMGAQPATIQAGLRKASASTDTVGPATLIDWPTPNTTLAGPILVTGEAKDSGGGVVAGVEVSVDGGTTWHPAQGHESWSYTWTPSALGSATLLARAVDDSGNLGAASAPFVVTVVQPGGSYSIWNDSFTPSATSVQGGGSSLELGIAFQSDVSGYVTGERFYKGNLNTGTHVGHLWDNNGNLLATATFTNETASGWQQVTFASPVAIVAGARYEITYHMDGANGGPVYFAQDGLYNGSYNSGVLHALESVGLYTSTFASPPKNGAQVTNLSKHRIASASTLAAPPKDGPFNYWVDVLFSNSQPDRTPPTILAQTPTAAATGVDPAESLFFAFNETIKPGSLKAELRDKAGKLVATKLTYDPVTRTAILTPITQLASTSTYTAKISGAADLAGNVMAPVTFSFTTRLRGTGFALADPTATASQSGQQ